ncbi:MAG: pantetheine-phosphate adenylyltransferase [Bacteroidota bacterium]|nr:pantetheine-phosphate adenylyltransferase [Bacteroidota bacterium]
MKKISIFPGTFAPFTKGHQAVVQQGLSIFQKIIIAVGRNSQKKECFSIEDRVNWIKEVYKKEARIEVISYNGLTIELCKKKKVLFILRGLRNSNDFIYEKEIAQINKELDKSIETFFVIPPNNVSYISSSVVRDIWRNGGDISKFIPEGIRL